MRVDSIPSKIWPLLLLGGFSGWIALYHAVSSWHGAQVSSDVQRILNLICYLLAVLWIDSDSMSHPTVYRTFDFPWLVGIIFPLYLPYYLWRTRGKQWLLAYLGFGLLFFSGELADLAMYFWLGSGE